MRKVQERHLVAGIALGLLSGALLPFTLGAASIIMLPSVIVATLGAWSGVAAALAASFSQLAVARAIGGGMLMLVVFTAMLLPAWGVFFLIGRRPRFEQGVKWSALMTLGALFMLLLSAWMAVRGSLIDALVHALRASVEALPGDLLGTVLGIWGQTGLFGPNAAGIDFTRALTAVERVQVLDGFARTLTALLQMSFVSMLLTSGALTGAVSYLLAARVAHRRALVPSVDYRHPRGWRLTPGLIIGPPACALACAIAHRLGLRGADAAARAFFDLSGLLFLVQGIGAADRRLHEVRVPKRYRTFTLVLLTLVGAYFLRIAGVFSALVGSKGLVTQYIKRHAGRNGKGDGDA